MAKRSKKNIKQIQDALLSNTGFLNREDSSGEETIHQDIIDDEVLTKYEALAEYEKTDTKTLINKALGHFLKLKGLQLEQALKNRK